MPSCLDYMSPSYPFPATPSCLDSSSQESAPSETASRWRKCFNQTYTILPGAAHPQQVTGKGKAQVPFLQCGATLKGSYRFQTLWGINWVLLGNWTAGQILPPTLFSSALLTNQPACKLPAQSGLAGNWPKTRWEWIFAAYTEFCKSWPVSFVCLD